MKSILLSSLAAVLFLGASTASAQVVKIGTVDMKRVFESYYKTKDAESKINEKRNGVKKELEDRMDVGKKAVEALKGLDEDLKRPELSTSAKAEKSRIRQQKQTDLQNMDREIRGFQANQEKELNELSVRMRAGIVEEINKVVAARVKAENYDIVFDRSGPSIHGVPIVMYSRESYDFTSDVITALNKTRGAASEAPAATPLATPKPKRGN